jgi:hypothetical protein
MTCSANYERDSRFDRSNAIAADGHGEPCHQEAFSDPARQLANRSKRTE